LDRTELGSPADWVDLGGDDRARVASIDPCRFGQAGALGHSGTSTQSSSDTEANATDANGAESGIPASFGSTDTAVVDMVGVDAHDVDDEEAIVTETVALTFDDDAPDSGLAAETGADESADAAQDGESEEPTGEGAQSDGDSADDAEDADQGDGDNDGASDADSKDADSKD
jgi:hypothetical protein